MEKNNKKASENLKPYQCWDIWTRTINNRTRICCVANYTISQFLSATTDRVPLFRNCDAKVVVFRKLTKRNRFFFHLNVIFLFQELE